MGEALDKALLAKEASRTLACLGAAERDGALRAMAMRLRAQTAAVLEANAADMEAARAAGTAPAMLDRLSLDAGRIEAMAAGVEAVAAQPDPLGRVVAGGRVAGGLSVEKVTVPLGVVAMVYEARPNVTADAAALCVKSGNAAVLRCGSSALGSCRAIARALRDGLGDAGLPRDAVCLLESGGHGAVDELLGLRGVVDVLVPRGGSGLIRACVDGARVPVIETGVGNCHVFVERSADVAMAADIVCNAKCSRPSVCNACETLLVDAGLLERDPVGPWVHPGRARRRAASPCTATTPAARRRSVRACARASRGRRTGRGSTSRSTSPAASSTGSTPPSGTSRATAPATPSAS